MKESPRRPLILKRRKLALSKKEEEVGKDEPDGAKQKSDACSGQQFPAGIRIMDHPSLPNTQVVVIPKTANLQSVIGALTAKGKECGAQGPNKFILLSSGGGIEDGPVSSKQSRIVAPEGDGISPVPLGPCGQLEVIKEHQGDEKNQSTSIMPLTEIKPMNKESDCSPLDESLTNIHWLGGMSSDGLPPCDVNEQSSKENQDSQMSQAVKESKEEHSPVKDPFFERPPYSYMAMIQFAINSTKSKQMTLKEIYTWIEVHFPYFRYVAKPGWKNSIRHNLSLHDMFTRETSPDGRISYWTIRPEANRCLTLEQVYKPVVEPAAPSPVQTVQVCEEQNQRPVVAEPKKVQAPKPSKAPSGSERKMKPLLPRTDSYLVPIQLPLTSPLILPATPQLPLSLPMENSSSTSVNRSGKKVRIAPKAPDLSSVPVFTLPQVEPRKDKELCISDTQTPEAQLDCPPRERKETSSSRRKQRLVLPGSEEPVILFPETSFFDSGLASDLSTFHESQEPDLDSPVKKYTFKTPIKGGLPASSTPSKTVVGEPLTTQEPWRTTPLNKGSHGVLDFSPIHTPRGVTLTPQQEDQTHFSFNSTPFKELPLFNSPRELLNTLSPVSLAQPHSSSPVPESGKLRRCSRELQVETLGTNRSLTEGLVLDTMNDSLSKILVDISFTGLEEEDFGMGNISWSQLIPELK
uniref:Forkhead box protein M1 n=1 Tax=Lepisosteus oculatus TaxID=7918 RepID=W5NII9_LEPOC|nr:PREDICTED: forkhead box protein M1 isoform X1 [Lepisosteus oculatus]XP_015208585.1 PREDICTED: forkhead box protein M1 isoform X1 [Lepisosteus oculatus]